MLIAINATKVEDTFKKKVVRGKYIMDYCIRKKYAVKSLNKCLGSIAVSFHFFR